MTSRYVTYFWGRNNWLLLLWCPSQSRPQSLRAFGEGMKDRTIAGSGDENKTIVSVLVQQRPLTVFPTTAGEFSIIFAIAGTLQRALQGWHYKRWGIMTYE